MDFPTVWRGFDLTERLAKIERAFARAEVAAPEEVPVMVNAPCYFAFGTADKPADYLTNPASMVEYQARGYERHLAEVGDDLVPYFMPWFGTGVLASAFGCEIRLPAAPDDDPAVAGPCLHSPADVARLKMPDPYRDGWMPRVLAAIDYARAHSDLPVGLTDMQGPLDTAGQMCGQQQLYLWMYEEPAAVHALFEVITAAFIEWVKVQKKHIGEPLDRSNGLQGVGASPIGVFEADDDMVMIGPRLYREFVVPHLSRIFDAFGGGSIHFCGPGYHHLEGILEVKNVRVVNNSVLGKFKEFGQFKRRLGNRVTVQLQDSAPLDPESYYRKLFAEVDDLRGLMIACFASDSLALSEDGGYVPVKRDPLDVARRIVKVVRECATEKLAGQRHPARPVPG